MPTASITVSSPENDRDISIFGEIMAESLRFPPITEFDWVSRIGRDNILIARYGGDVAGGAMLVPMGQYFGGKRVEMIGIHGVGVAPAFRGLGVGSSLMKGVVREISRRNCPISTLYPATQPIYRSVGFEQAGTRTRYSYAREAFQAGDRSLEIVRYDESYKGAVCDLYESVASRRDGHVSRSEWNWERIIEPRGKTAHGYIVLDGSEPIGYAFFVNAADANMPYYRIELTDVLATTPKACERLVSLFADHRSMITGVSWFGSSADPLAFQLREQNADITWRMIWMLRVVDVQAAIESRGYAKSLSADLSFDIEDDLIEKNAGAWQVRVADGVARVEKGGSGDLQTSICGLAALYSGYLSAVELARMGVLHGDHDAVLLADEVFCSRTPSMVDMF